MLTICWSF